MTVADLNGADFVGLDWPPCHTAPPARVSRAARSSSPTGTRAPSRRPPCAGGCRRSTAWAVRPAGRRTAPGRPAAVRRRRLRRGALHAAFPTGAGHRRPAGGGRGGRRAGPQLRQRGRLDEPDGGAPLASLVSTRRTPEGGHAIAFAPELFVDCSWANPVIGQGDAKFGGPGAGWVEYAVPLPEGLDFQGIRRLRLLFEAGARTARSRLGWADPAHIKLTDYPQTEARKRSSRVVVSIDGRPIGEATLPDDPADARGVLSFQAQRQWMGSYGFSITLSADEATTRELLQGGPRPLDGALRGAPRARRRGPEPLRQPCRGLPLQPHPPPGLTPELERANSLASSAPGPAWAASWLPRARVTAMRGDRGETGRPRRHGCARVRPAGAAAGGAEAAYSTPVRGPGREGRRPGTRARALPGRPAAAERGEWLSIPALRSGPFAAVAGRPPRPRGGRPTEVPAHQRAPGRPVPPTVPAHRVLLGDASRPLGPRARAYACSSGRLKDHGPRPGYPDPRATCPAPRTAPPRPRRRGRGWRRKPAWAPAAAATTADCIGEPASPAP